MEDGGEGGVQLQKLTHSISLHLCVKPGSATPPFSELCNESLVGFGVIQQQTGLDLEPQTLSQRCFETSFIFFPDRN